MSPKIMMSAAEISADILGSYLARELKGCQLFGMGGARMREAGVDVRLDITDKSSIGIIEALKFIPSHLITLSKLKKMLQKEKPDALILIDAQGLNMPLASYAKKMGIRTIYYVAPQEWLWGTKKGVEKVSKTIDLIISIFKQENEIYKSAGANSVYFGHPLLDIVRPAMNREQFCRKFDIDPAKKIIALCPGSRQQEIKSLLPILIDTAEKIKEAQFLMPVPSLLFKQRILDRVSRSKVKINLIEGHNYDVLANSDLVIAKSGTIVMECVCLGTPVIMFYKLSRLTYYIAKHMLKVNLPFYSMPNLLAGRQIVPEYLMEKATSENLSREAENILKSPEKMVSGYKEVIQLMGSPGATKKAAEKIIEFVKGR